jgi:hypothetical protein
MCDFSHIPILSLVIRSSSAELLNPLHSSHELSDWNTSDDDAASTSVTMIPPLVDMFTDDAHTIRVSETDAVPMTQEAMHRQRVGERITDQNDVSIHQRAAQYVASDF